MAKLKFLNQVPPTGWWYIQPESRLRLEADSLQELVQKVIDHRKYKSLSPTDTPAVALEVERQICSRLGKDHCRPDGKDDPWVPIGASSTLIKASNVLSFSKAMFEWVASGMQLVSDEKAKARAALCAKCPINWPLTGCKCGPAMTVIQNAVPASKRIEGLGVCMVCECSLPAKVLLPRNVIDASNKGRNLQFPKDGSCWQYNEANES